MVEGKSKAIGGVIIFSLLVLWIALITIRRAHLAINHQYTIGLTIERRFTPKGPRVDYTFNVNGVQYSASKDPDTNTITYSGGRYYVEFLPSDPQVNDILWDKPVHPSITEAPAEGWKVLPE